MFTSLFQQARVLNIHFLEETLVSAEEMFDFPVLGVWGSIIGMGVPMWVSACYRG